MLAPQQVLRDGDPKDFYMMKLFLEEHHQVSKYIDCHISSEIYSYVLWRIGFSQVEDYICATGLCALSTNP